MRSIHNTATHNTETNTLPRTFLDARIRKFVGFLLSFSFNVWFFVWLACKHANLTGCKPLTVMENWSSLSRSEQKNSWSTLIQLKLKHILSHEIDYTESNQYHNLIQGPPLHLEAFAHYVVHLCQVLQLD